MAFNIEFSASKISKKAANTNIHDELLWDFAYMLAERTTPINQWPQQYTVHYIYEFMNRPWLPERTRLNETVNWMQRYAPNLEIHV